MGIPSRHVLLPLLFLLAPAPVRAERPPSESWTVTAQLENDLFADTDQFYTNGIKLSFISPDLEWFRDLKWLQRERWAADLANAFIDMLPFSGDASRQKNLSLSVGQMMYTPRDIETGALTIDDRPYAGWLYGSAAFHSKSYRVLDTFELQAGLTGPWSLAEQAQDLVHEVRGIDKARGWDNQIDTELGVAFIYDRKYRVLPRRNFVDQWGMDAIIHGGGAIGTVFTHLSAGMEARIGWNVPSDFGSALIRPAGQTNMPTDTSDPRYSPDAATFSFLIFAAASGRLVGRDIFLDGNTFSDSHNIDKKLLVGDLVVGTSLIWRRFKLSYAHVLRTDEFEGQPDSQYFGSLSLSFTY